MSAGRKNNSHKKDYNTPPKYIKPVTDFFVKIYLDPCSNSYSLVNAQVNFIYPDKDGLKEEWNYPTIFVNPPYGRNSENKTSIYNWIQKGLEANQKYQSEIIYLIPVATNTKHFKDLIFKHFTSICFLADTRLKFYNQGKEDVKGAPMSCCLIYIGKRNKEFNAIFSNYGKIFNI